MEALLGQARPCSGWQREGTQFILDLYGLNDIKLNICIGTKLHQQTRKAIAKRQPVLMSAIHKFNKYCKQLEQLYDPEYAIPLPTPLSVKLADLRNDQTLLHNVWITPSKDISRDGWKTVTFVTGSEPS